MDAFVVFLGLALGVAVLLRILDELLPIKAPAALAHTFAVAIAALVCWGLDYSVFSAYGQELRTAWMHPVATGLALVGTGEVLRQLVGGFTSHRGTRATA